MAQAPSKWDPFGKLWRSDVGNSPARHARRNFLRDKIGQTGLPQVRRSCSPSHPAVCSHPMAVNKVPRAVPDCPEIAPESKGSTGRTIQIVVSGLRHR
jgi:hypothetical protein